MVYSLGTLGGSGWLISLFFLQGCPLPPSLFHVCPSQSCLLSPKGWPSLNTGGPVFSYGYRSSCAPPLELPNKLTTTLLMLPQTSLSLERRFWWGDLWELWKKWLKINHEYKLTALCSSYVGSPDSCTDSSAFAAPNSFFYFHICSISHPRFPFYYPTNQHFMTDGIPLILCKDSKYACFIFNSKWIPRFACLCKHNQWV